MFKPRRHARLSKRRRYAKVIRYSTRSAKAAGRAASLLNIGNHAPTAASFIDCFPTTLAKKAEMRLLPMQMGDVRNL